MTLPVELETSVNQLRLKHAALIDAVNAYRSGTIDTSKQELLEMAAAFTGRLEIEEYTLLGQVARKAGLSRRVANYMRWDAAGGPNQLFTNDEQGAWYDPSDLSTLFQDAAGTTPVTADGDPVGLMLDKSQGMARGPELLQNSGFDEGLAGWNYTDTATEYVELVDGGVRLVTNSYVVSRVEQTLSDGNLAGKLIEISADVSGFVGGARARISVTGSPFFTVPSSTRNTDGKLTLFAAVPQGTNTIRVLFTNIGGGPAVESSFLVDNTSTRVVPGNHVSQSVAASRPVYRTDGALHWLEFDGVDDELTSGKQVVNGLDYWWGASHSCLSPSRVGVIFASANHGSDSHALYTDTRNSPRRVARAYNLAIVDRLARLPANTPEVISAQVSSQQIHGWVNSELQGTAASSTDTGGISDFRLGGYTVIRNNFKFYCGLVLNRSITEDEREAAETWLASKGGITL